MTNTAAMTSVAIKRKSAQKLRDIAQHENRSISDVLETMIERYQPIESASEAETAEAEYQEQRRSFHKKLYAKARAYWQKMGDQERLKLTDEQLDEQFWLFDPEGIPRLKSEQGTIEIPPDPLEAFVELFPDSKLTDMSTTVPDTVAEHYRKQNGRTD